MRRNYNVPAEKSSPAVLHCRGAALPINPFSLSTLNRFCSFSFECSQQNFFIKEYCTCQFEISGQRFLFQVTPLFGFVQYSGNFFDGKIERVHINLFSLTTILLIAHPTPKLTYYFYHL